MATIQKINGIKQTWHTIEFSNNHTNPTTTPHTVKPPLDSANKRSTRHHEPHQTRCRHNTKPNQKTKSNRSERKVKSTSPGTKQLPTTRNNTSRQPASKVKSEHRYPDHTQSNNQKAARPCTRQRYHNSNTNMNQKKHQPEFINNTQLSK